MAKFRFPLQAALSYREHVERQRRLAVARLLGERRRGEGVITGYQARIREVKQDLRGALSPRPSRDDPAVDPRVARLQAAASLHLRLKAQRAAVSLAGVLSRLEEARKKLALAAVDRRALDKLRENRLAAWNLEQSRREDRELDEIGTMRAARLAAESLPSHGSHHGVEP